MFPRSQMTDSATIVGFIAAFCTTVSYVPQLKKCWQSGRADDLSLRMFTILAVGIAAWVIYGVLRTDVVIVIANSVSLCLLAGILFFKLRAKPETTSSSARRG
jgi:MtN3 and saliva related transmembrane protein